MKVVLGKIKKFSKFKFNENQKIIRVLANTLMLSTIVRQKAKDITKQKTLLLSPGPENDQDEMGGIVKDAESNLTKRLQPNLAALDIHT